MLTSVYMRFRRRFSSAIAFISLIRLASMPPYFARHLYSVALLMPCSRHSSAAGTTPSIWRSTPMNCASVNRVFLIGISSFILPRKFFFRISFRSVGITIGLVANQTSTAVDTRRFA